MVRARRTFLAGAGAAVLASAAWGRRPALGTSEPDLGHCVDLPSLHAPAPECSVCLDEDRPRRLDAEALQRVMGNGECSARLETTDTCWGDGCNALAAGRAHTRQPYKSKECVPAAVATVLRYLGFIDRTSTHRQAIAAMYTLVDAPIGQPLAYREFESTFDCLGIPFGATERATLSSLRVALQAGHVILVMTPDLEAESNHAWAILALVPRDNADGPDEAWLVSDPMLPEPYEMSPFKVQHRLKLDSWFIPVDPQADPPTRR